MTTFFIRIAIFGIAIYFVAMNICAFAGIDISDYSYVLLLEYLLYLFAKSNRKAHCRWARFLALTIFAVDTFTYLDAKLNLVPSSIPYLLIISSAWIISISVTTHLAIKHIRAVMRLNQMRNERQIK